MNIQLFEKYLSGEIEINLLENYLNLYQDKSSKFEMDFYLTVINSNQKISQEVLHLLFFLNVEAKLAAKFLSKKISFYQLLKELVKENDASIQLHQLLNILEEKKRKSVNDLTLGFKGFSWIIALLMGIYLYINLEFVLELLYSSIYTMPLMGIFFSCTSVLISIFLNHLDARQSAIKCFRDDCFLLLNNSLTITGKLLLILGNSCLIFSPTYFFIAAACCDTIKELFYLVDLQEEHVQNPLFPSNSLINIHQQYARYVYDYQKQRNKFIINLIASVCITTLVIAGFVIPAGFALSLAITGLIILTDILKKVFIRINEQKMASYLQSELKEIKSCYPQHSEEKEDLLLQQYSKEVSTSLLSKAHLSTAVDSLPPISIKKITRLPFFKASIALPLKKDYTLAAHVFT